MLLGSPWLDSERVVEYLENLDLQPPSSTLSKGNFTRPLNAIDFFSPRGPISE